LTICCPRRRERSPRYFRRFRARQPPSPPFIDPHGYGRHLPEHTLLYQLVEQHFPYSVSCAPRTDPSLPNFVRREFDAYLECSRLEEGFLRCC